jgi:L-2-amino-thiazoline-4-carboxylic acid hydrolase
MPSKPTSAHAAWAADDARYRPDPARETRQAIDSFVKALVAAEPGEHDLEARVRRRHRDLINAQQACLPDEQAWAHLKMALVLLAAYQELQQHYRDEILLPRLREAFVEPLRPYVARATSSSLQAAADPFSAMVAISRERERTFFGKSFVFGHPADDDRQYIAEVRRCFYHDVLAANDAARLTPVLCAFDATWIDEIDPSRHGFIFERPATIGTGGATCPFTFTRRPQGGARI